MLTTVCTTQKLDGAATPTPEPVFLILHSPRLQHDTRDVELTKLASFLLTVPRRVLRSLLRWKYRGVWVSRYRPWLTTPATMLPLSRMTALAVGMMAMVSLPPPMSVT